jgi:peptidoglycan/xylan/chitin deacetylase (PgdA/CDA1 family)
MFNVDWGSEYIPGILDVLEHAGARSTFFVTGTWARKNPGLLLQMHQRGHEIANHGQRHVHVMNLTPSQVERLILELDHHLRSVLGVWPSRLFAPPYGETSAESVRAASAVGYRTILWTVDTVDWKRPAAQVIVKRVERAGAGALVLMHPTAPTLEALPAVLARLSARGLRATTVSEVLGPALR